MQCPVCSADNQSGSFCAACGAALSAGCPSCGAEVEPGARFCTACGARVAEAAGGGGKRDWAPWILAAVSLVVVVALVVVFIPGGTMTTSSSAPSGSAPMMNGAGGASGDGVLSTDMRTNADRLFNRIMMAAEQGNQAEVDQFMPMAIQAYEMVESLDFDGQFHLGLLHLTAGTPELALVTANRILDQDPRHLLGLAVAAKASTALGDEGAVAGYWERFLEAYDSEAGKPMPEYVDHQPLLPEYRAEAQAALGR